MKIVVLISCMHEKDHSILDKTQIDSDAIVINQCDTDLVQNLEYVTKSGKKHRVLYVNTTSRGLSKSRNLALSYAREYDVALVCDDDERLSSNYSETIQEVYKNHPNTDVIAFAIDCDQYTRVYSNHEFNLGFKEILKTSSQQISFKPLTIHAHNIVFDEKMGSGTGNGAGEETKFLLTCREKGLKMIYNPFVVAKIVKGESQWFSGYTPKFFIDQGWTDRRLLGPILGFIYMIYWTIFKQNVYKKDGLGVYSALKYSLKGFFTKR